ncbi:MAG: hypothetical protein HKO71_02810 [Pseudomonadales bacterium]|nr:hypothetical protein [Pseudomonadales bacterium]
MTDSPLALLHDVGTIDNDSGQRMGATLTGFDTPSILGAWNSAPHLHDGSAATLQDAIAAHTTLPVLQASDRDALASFIQQAEPGDTADMIDSDGDGWANFQDPASGNACVPSAFNANCGQDTDSDGVSDFSEGETTDSDSSGTVDYLEPCVPSAFNANCGQDTDSDGVSDFDEGETTDSDGDGLFDYQESSQLDDDGDTFNNQQDPDNTNSCVPELIFCSENVPTLPLLHSILLALALAGVLYRRAKMGRIGSKS